MSYSTDMKVAAMDGRIYRSDRSMSDFLEEVDSIRDEMEKMLIEFTEKTGVVLNGVDVEVYRNEVTRTLSYTVSIGKMDILQ